MTYTFGETHQTTTDLNRAITIAEAKQADLQAALRLQHLEETNARTQAAIYASETRTANAIAKTQQIHHTYPTHPNWRQNQIEANREMREWGRRHKALAAASRVTGSSQEALQGVAGKIAPHENSGLLESDTGVAA